ncbi:hypothetical protein M0802_002567 [Mischocyttarus mexicanus]|nr:hypothetical protein M0802_002567 [Mischocyttarus mexicanus]
MPSRVSRRLRNVDGRTKTGGRGPLQILQNPSRLLEGSGNVVENGSTRTYSTRPHCSSKPLESSTQDDDKDDDNEEANE